MLMDLLHVNSIGLSVGIGTSAGWLYPISKLIAQRYITISECNAIVKAVTTFFREICLPGALTSFYNPYGELFGEPSFSASFHCLFYSVFVPTCLCFLIFTY